MPDEERILGRLRPGEGIVGRVFHTGLPVAIPDLADEPIFLNRTGSWRDVREDPRALYAVPLREVRSTLGVLTAERRWANGTFSFDADLRVLTTAASMLATRVRLHRAENPLARARTDSPALLPVRERFRGVVGTSAPWRQVLDVVDRVAQSRATVLLRGESGTGKEVVARAIHENGSRAGRAFVAVNCAALPESLLESELFGHERGAFTGAAAARPGRFELADGGTIFLDEIGELPVGAQVKLLRVLQERQFERVGGRRTVTVDVRVVAATNRDLEEAVRSGAFRLDLYHRVQVVEIVLPPLRDRADDVPRLAEAFLADLAAEHGRRLILTRDAMLALQRLQWPGTCASCATCWSGSWSPTATVPCRRRTSTGSHPPSRRAARSTRSRPTCASLLPRRRPSSRDRPRRRSATASSRRSSGPVTCRRARRGCSA